MHTLGYIVLCLYTHMHIYAYMIGVWANRQAWRSHAIEPYCVGPAVWPTQGRDSTGV